MQQVELQVTPQKKDKIWCVSVHQPWASLIAYGFKTIKANQVRTKHRGRIAIHACQTIGRAGKLALKDQGIRDAMASIGLPYDELSSTGFHEDTPFGSLVGTADLVDCIPVEKATQKAIDLQQVYGDFSPGGHLWVFEGARLLSKPVPCRGNVTLFKVTNPE